jgi:outer membrane protein assembly factor BamB
MNLKFPHAIVFILLTLTVTGTLAAQDWPRFRGPVGNGVLEKLEHPTEWSNDQNIAWSVDMPGGGLSSPIVQSDRIFLTTAVGANPPVSFSEGVRDMRPKKPDAAVKFQVMCLNLIDGSRNWAKHLYCKWAPK